MTSSKSTKRALVSSALAILMCVAMLIGTTFAWFTDTASTAVNKIQAGNLKMEVSYKNTKDGEFAKVSKETPVLNNSALWEPGHVEFAVLKVKNVGSLALKYKLGINIVSETASYNASNKKFNLSDYIKYAVISGDKSGETRAELVAEAEAADGKLIKEGYSKESKLKTTKDTNEALNNEEIVTLVVWMPTTVGNEANYSTKQTRFAPAINLGIEVAATQYNYENDSFDNTYDENAPYPVAVSSARELTAAVKNGGYVVLKKDIDLGIYAVPVPAGKDVTIDLNGKTVTTSGNFAEVAAGAKLTINGGTVNAGRYALRSNGGEIVVNGGNFISQETTCGVTKAGKLTINGGTFTAKDNCVIATNGNEENAGSEITINGGVFNANIQSAGYIACGIYVANKDTVTVNGGTFNVTDGVGILMRAGKTTIGKDVVINLTSTGNVSKGRVGDAATEIEVGKYLVSDTTIPYPGLDETFTITNNTDYALVEYN